MNPVDELLEAIIRFDAKNEPYNMTVARGLDHVVSFEQDNRICTFIFHPEYVYVKITDRIDIQEVKIWKSKFGPSLPQLCYAYLLWVMGN